MPGLECLPALRGTRLAFVQIKAEATQQPYPDLVH